MVYDIDPDELKKWAQLSEGLPVIGLRPDISPAELRYLHQRYGYVQIVNPFSLDEFTEVQFIRLSSGLLMFDYGNAITVSFGEKLLTDAYYKVENGNTERVCTGVGTRIKQIVDSGVEAAHWAIEKNWPEILIAGGTEDMCWGVWKGAKDRGVEVSGYEPSLEQQAKYERIKANCPTLITTKTPSP